MTQEEFNVVFELQMRKCADILAHKKKEYTGDNIDRLSAFKIAAALQNCDPKAALAGMMSKHVVSLYDMCYSTVDCNSVPYLILDDEHSDFLQLLSKFLNIKADNTVIQFHIGSMVEYFQ